VRFYISKETENMNVNEMETFIEFKSN